MAIGERFDRQYNETGVVLIDYFARNLAIADLCKYRILHTIYCSPSLTFYSVYVNILA